ncbi:MAG: tRNA uridine-5-carboxymethylaminomethyl(34) synthesis GTPase MnmE, partial [Aestuariivirgaceae bacterium]
MTPDDPGQSGDTIYALSSGAGRAGVAVIRLSGPRVRDVVAGLCGPVPAPRMVAVRRFVSPASKEAIDQGVLLWMPGPHSFTGEDVAEFQVHGGRAVIERLLSALAETGLCRIAEAGEFTRMAFHNCKMDLVAVEGLADLIAADTEAQRQQALFHQFGVASERYQALRTRLTATLAHIEAAIDFVDEEGVEEIALGNVHKDLDGLRRTLTGYLDDDHRGERLRDGVKVVIAGAPNVGKSSLLNALARRDAAIVSPIEGTTRDAIEVAIDIAGVPCLFVDTAGLRQATTDQIEQLGMARTAQHMRDADLTIWVSAPDVPPTDIPALDSDTLRVLNKIDLLDDRSASGQHDMALSALDEADVQTLIDKLAGIVANRFLDHEPAMITRHRHRVALENCL